MDLVKEPEPVSIQITAVQNLVGRGTDLVRVFGYRINDALRRTVEFSVTADEAVTFVEFAHEHHQFPQVNVDEREWSHVLSIGKMDVIRISSGEDA